MLASSELILRPDGSIYHLGVSPGELATTIITVGDPDRVDKVAKYLDRIDMDRQSREFRCLTGELHTQRISIVSTGIGTDNIDIVFNEIDALFNIDFRRREIKDTFTQLSFIRLGTSGTLQDDIHVDDILISKYAIGTDGLLHYYKRDRGIQFNPLDEYYSQRVQWPLPPYFTRADPQLYEQFLPHCDCHGITITAAGFYGPQGREIRLSKSADWIQQAASLRDRSDRVTNLEMETAGIYGISELLGHRAVSISAILAHRARGLFSDHPDRTVDRMIERILDRL